MADDSKTLRKLLDHIPQGVSIFDTDLNALAFNKRFIKLLEFPDGYFQIGDPFEKFIRFNAERGEYGEGDVEEQVRVRVEAARSLKAHNFERVRPDGTIIEIKGEPIAGGGFVTTYTDITEHKALNEALRSTKVLLEKSFESLEEVVLIVDAGTRKIIACNPAVKRIFGYKESEVIGKNTSFLHVSEDAYKEFGKALFLSLDTKNKFHIEFSVQRKDGVVIPTEHTVTEIRNEMGDRTQLVSVIRDITERKRAEEKLRNARDELELKVQERTKNLSESTKEAQRANRAKSEFLSSMSHELRTPMNAILGFGQLLENLPGESLSEKQHEYVQLILRSGEHLLELINDVLDLAKIESGNVDINIEEFAPKDVIFKLVSIIEKLMSEKNIEFVDECDGRESVPIMADKTKFTQVLLNIFSNSIKYNINGGKVVLRCDQVAGNQTRISISDTGRGIPKGKEHQLFTPFNRLGIDSNKIPGTGIGLTISKQLVELMAGRIGFESVEGKGSTFWVEFPIAK